MNIVGLSFDFSGVSGVCVADNPRRYGYSEDSDCYSVLVQKLHGSSSLLIIWAILVIFCASLLFFAAIHHAYYMLCYKCPWSHQGKVAFLARYHWFIRPEWIRVSPDGTVRISKVGPQQDTDLARVEWARVVILHSVFEKHNRHRWRK